MTTLRLKNVRERPERTDGHRVLVDRLWPRGVSKEDASLDDWCREVATSEDLRHWFDHRADRFDAFRERYRAELDDNDAPTGLDGILREHDSGY